MMESLQTSAQLTTVVEADVTPIAMLRNKRKQAFFERTGVKLSYFAFLASAAVSALAEHRMLNASLNSTATEVTYHDSCHLGIAVDSPKGRMVPVVRGART
jgi:2-oxoglutarate dehydrogenase E2 component (dihydrolipoamide succinyltransferase)